MNNSKKNKVNIIIVIIAICISLVLVSTGTYAYWIWQSTVNKDVVFNTSASIEEYIVYTEGESKFVGNFQPTSTFCEGQHITLSVYKKEEAAAVKLNATIKMDVNVIGQHIAESEAVHWVLTEGDSTITCTNGLNESTVVNSGSFNGILDGTTLDLASDIEITTTNKTYTVWIWIDSSGINLNLLSGETIDTNIWTQIDMLPSDTTAADVITELYTNAEKTQVTNNGIQYNQAQSVSLMNDRLGGTTADYNAGNIRYYGANPNNYIYFNCSDYSNQTESTCEKWRIIGVFDGKLKIIPNHVMSGYHYFDDYMWKNDVTNIYNYATIKDVLNERNSDYLVENGITSYYTTMQSKNNKTVDLIAKNTWYTNKLTNINIYLNSAYVTERSGNGRWNGEIALLYPSDYGYAGDLEKCTGTLSNHHESECANANWINQDVITSSDEPWLITPSSDSSNWAIYEGYFESLSMTTTNVLPALYLKSTTLFNGIGDGTSGNPFQIMVLD